MRKKSMRAWARYHITNGQAAKLWSSVEIVSKYNGPNFRGSTCWAASEDDGWKIVREARRNGAWSVVLIPYWLARLEERRERGQYPKYRDS